MIKRDRSLIIMFGLFLVVLTALTLLSNKEDKTEDNDVFCLNNVQFHVKSACTDNNKIKLKIQNDNYELNGLGINILEKNFEINENFNKNELKNVIFEVGDLKFDRVKVFSKINYNEDLILCNNYQDIRNIDSCSNSCSDGTLNNQCSDTKPLFCLNSKLINDCKKCGCGDKLYCNNQTCSNCRESWFCGEFNECVNGKQKRNCFDSNSCGTFFNKPLTEQ